LQYRPFPAAEATRVLESEVNAAQFRAIYKRRTGRDETARDSYDQARARQAAAEEAAGAGVCLVSLYVTVTVPSDAELPRAAAQAAGWPPAGPGAGYPAQQAPVPPAWGWKIPGAGRAAHVAAAPEYQATTTQACGLFPFPPRPGRPPPPTP